MAHAAALIKRTKGGKPFLAQRPAQLPDAPNWNFNVSHEARLGSRHARARTYAHVSAYVHAACCMCLLHAACACACCMCAGRLRCARGRAAAALRSRRRRARPGPATPMHAHMCTHMTCARTCARTHFPRTAARIAARPRPGCAAPRRTSPHCAAPRRTAPLAALRLTSPRRACARSLGRAGSHGRWRTTSRRCSTTSRLASGRSAEAAEAA